MSPAVQRSGPHIGLFVLLLTVLAAFPHRSQTQAKDPIHAATLRGIDSLYSLRFDAAEAVFDDVIRMNPDDPRGWFFKSMVHFYVYQLTRDRTAYDRFFELSETVIDKAEELVDENDNDLVARFYLGGIYGYRGLAFNRHGNLLSALWDGRKGYGYLREAATGPTFAVDAKFGFGLFTYLVGKIPRSYSWILGILGFSGDVERGLDMMRAAADGGIYTRTEAAFYYAQFCFFEGRYDTAYVYMQRIMNAYPGNSLFLVTFAAWELRQDRIDKAIEVATRAIEVNKRNQIHIGDEFAYSTLAAAYYVRNEFSLAIGNWERYIELTQNSQNISNYVYYRLGIAHEILGERSLALKAWQSMEENTDEDDPWTSVYWRRGKRFVSIPLSPAEVLGVIGSNLQQAGKRRESMEYFDRALLAVGPDNETRAVLMYEKLEALQACNEHEQVLALGAEILRLNPRRELWTLPHTLYLMSQSYRSLRRIPEAREALHQALRYEDYDWEVRLRNRVQAKLEEIDKED